MKGFLPPRPDGDDEEFLYHQSIWDRVHGPAGQINSSNTVIAERTTKGIRLRAAAGGGAQFRLRLCKVTTLFEEDYIGVKLWNPLANDGDGDFVGREFLVAKSIPSRMPDEETIDQDLIDYTYADDPDADNYRKAHLAGDDPSEFEWQVVHPRYVDDDPDNGQEGDLIIVAKVSNGTGVLDQDGKQIYFVELQPCRYWAKQFSQSGPP